MNTYNPMLEDVDDSEESKIVDKNYVVTAKSDDDKYYYVLSDSMQSTLKQYEEGKEINTKGNPIIDKYEKFSSGGKEYYGVEADKFGAVGSGQEKWFDTYKWEFDLDTKKAKYYGGETELSRLFDDMDVPSGYDEFVKDSETLEDEVDFDVIPTI